MDIGNWIREFVFHPRWAGHRVSDAIRRRLDRASHKSLIGQLSKYVLPLPDALAGLLGIPGKDVEKVLEGYAPPALAAQVSVIPKSWGASPNLLKAYFVLCNILKPRLVVETGVATGVSSALLLRELDAVHGARLISLELPGLGRRDISYIGSSVPAHLRSRWTLIVDAAVPALRRMRNLAGKVDIFIHDSDHSYDNQSREYRIALNLLRPGGILVSDDVDNDAFFEICGAAQGVPVIAHRRENQSYIGFMRKPS